MNANIMKTYFFYKIIYDLKYHFYLLQRLCDFFTLRPSDLFTILTNILMDNFCPY